MSEWRYATVQDVHRLADFARAQSLAQRGFTAMARVIVSKYAVGDRPQILAEVGIDTPRRG